MKKIVIWALFDDAKSSCKNSIKKYFNENVEVHSVGINDINFDEKTNYFYHKIDLSLLNLNLIDELNNLPKPDIILASPPCESWSRADCDGAMVKAIKENNVWEIRNNKYYENFNKNAHPVKKRCFIQKETSRLLGESTAGATLKIIKVFRPRFWVIENPQTSKIWDFINFHWCFKNDEITYDNLTYYSAYDTNFSLKPTIFKSNLNLYLKTDRIKGNSNHIRTGNYSLRSSIPSLLIRQVVGEIMSVISWDKL